MEEDRLTITFFYGKTATLRWDSDRWRWTNGSRFFNHTTKMGRNSVIIRIPGVTRAAKKWQCYLFSNYRFQWSQVYDPLRSGKEAAFIWSIWHKVEKCSKNDMVAFATQSTLITQFAFIMSLSMRCTCYGSDAIKLNVFGLL